MAIKKLSLKDRDGQREVMAKLDAASSILDAMPSAADMILNADKYLYKSAMNFLFDLIQKMGVTESELKEWIVDILTVVLPSIEASVKTALLANIKKVVDCRIDPRIPDNIRKPYSDGYFTPKDLKAAILDNDMRTRGLVLNLDAIDPNAILSVSPFVGDGKELYFGQYKRTENGVTVPENYTEEVDEFINYAVKPMNPYNFTRAEDFNAFLWFCVHKGKLPSPTILNIKKGEPYPTIEIGGITYNVLEGKSVADYIKISGNPETNWSIKEGSTFTCADNKTMLSCMINRYGPYADIVPVSSDWNSCNWYVDRSRYYSHNLTAVSLSEPRNYGEEMGICSIKYMQPYDYASRSENVNIQGTQNLLFYVLPKPYVLTPTAAFKYIYKEGSEKPKFDIDFKFALKKILFNPNGEPDSKGKYTINPSLLQWASSSVDNSTKTLLVPLKNSTFNFFYKDRATYGFMNDNNIVIGSACVPFMTECYNRLTVYEFNYDFVMGMRLFDPGVITKKMLNNILNPEYYMSLLSTFGSRGSNSFNASMASSRLKLMLAIRKMIDEDEEFSECLFHFSNEDYDSLLEMAADEYYHEIPYKRWNMPGATVDTSTLDRILDGFPSDGSPDIQRKLISRAITEAEAIIEEVAKGNGSDTMISSDANSVKTDFCQQMLYSLAAILVDAIISPKLLLLMEVNRQLMGEGDNTDVSVSFDSLMDAVKGIVNSVINEIKEAIMQKLLDYILSYIAKIQAEIYARYNIEQYEFYLAVLMKLLALFKKGVGAMSAISSMISNKFGEHGVKYSEENYGDFNIDLPTAFYNTSYFDYVPPSKIEEPQDLNC